MPAASPTRLAVGLCSGVVAVAFEAMAVATAMPAAAADLGGVELYGWIFSLFVLSMLFATVLAGRLADRVGPVIPLGIGFAVFLIGLVISGFAPTMVMLLAGRVLQGLGSGFVNLGFAVVIAHAFAPARQATIMSWFSTAWIVPSFVGPPIAAAITTTWSWHWVFFAVVPLIAVAVAVGGPPLLQLQRAGTLLTEPGGAVPAPIWAGALVAGGAAAIQFAGQASGVTGIAVGLAGAVGLAIAVPALMPPGFARLRPGLSPTILTRGLLAGAFFGAQSFFPLQMVQAHGWGLYWAGATLTVGSVGWTTGAWLQSRPWTPLRRDQMVTLGSALLVAGLAVIAVVGWFPGTWLGLVVVGWILAGLGMGFATASTSLVVMSTSGRAQQGRNNAGLQVAEALGNSLLVGLAGTIFATLRPTGDLAATFGWLVTAMVGFAVLGLLASLRIGPVANAVHTRDPA